MGDMRINIAGALAQAQKKRTQNDSCGYDPVGQGDLFFINVFNNSNPTSRYNIINSTNPDKFSGQMGDIPINLPKAYRKFRLTSILQGHVVADIWMHLTPIGMQYLAGAFIAPFPTGSENWFKFQEPGTAVGQAQSTIILKKAVDSFYLTVSDGSGSQPQFTICAYNDAIDDKSILGGIHY